MIANFTPRVVGSLIDLILVLIISSIIIFVWAYFVGLSGSESHMSRQASEVTWNGRSVLVGLLADMTYTIWLQAGSNGATFGQKTMGLRLVTAKYEKPTLGALILRYFMSLVSSIFLKIGFLIALFSDKKQTLHDMVAGTIVVHTSGDSMPYTTHSAKYGSKMSPKYNDSLANIGEQETIKIEDIFYENALEEFNLNRRSGAWIKTLTENSGDEVKSKFDYIKLRAKELSIENRRIILRCDNCTQKIRVKNISGTLECPACKHSWFFDKEIRGGVSLRINEVKSKQQAGNVFINEIKLFFNSFNMLGYFSIGIVLLLILIEFIY